MSEQDKGPLRPARARLHVDWHQVNVWLDAVLKRRPARLGLLAGFVLLTAAFLAGTLRGGDVSLARFRVGERAETNIKAVRDFYHDLGAESLERERTAAEQAVRPVFDYRTDLPSILLARVGRAFHAVSVERDRFLGERLRSLKAPAERANGESSAEDDGAAAKGAPAEKRQTLAEFKESARALFSSVLQTTVPKPLFDRLWEAEFSADVRASVSALIGVALSDWVVSHSGVLEPFRGQAVIIRPLLGGSPSGQGEQEVTDLKRIHDLEDVGELVGRQANVHAAKLSGDVRAAVVRLVNSLIVPNLAFSRSETERRKEEARAAVSSRSVRFVKGQIIVRDGEPITSEHLAILRDMALEGGDLASLRIVIGLAIAILILLTTFYGFASEQFRRLCRQPRDLLMMALLILGMLILSQWVLVLAEQIRADLRMWVYLLPIAAGAMLVRLLVTAEAAALFAVVVSLLVGLGGEHGQPLGLSYTLFALVTGLVGARHLARVQSRNTLLRAGLYAGLAGAVVVAGLHFYAAHGPNANLFHGLIAATVGGILAALVTIAVQPALERVFDYTTDLTLLELANLNHPLLRELMLRAPGTYHHSMILGSLSESACEAIGANGLLARVACQYHDVGKMKNSAYFGENTKAPESPHHRLKPSMSALIIKSHIKDSMEMMREHGIPETVINVATQHHGTTLIEYFYHKALEQKEPGEEVREEDYRYPGVKPQSREAGVIMLADGVEAAARSLPEPTEDRLRAVVQRVINAKFTDGQLAHTDLTLRDLHLIARSFLQVLGGIYHQRPTYPWQRESRGDDRPDDSKRQMMTQRDGKRRRDNTLSDGKPAVAAVGNGGGPEAATKESDGRSRRTKEARESRELPPREAKDRGKQKMPQGAAAATGDADEQRRAGRSASGDAERARSGESAAEPGDARADEAAGAADLKRLGLDER